MEKSAKYIELAKELRVIINRQIEAGIEKLPTETQLCDKYQLSRQTVRAALALLENEKLILRRQGSGCIIHPRLISRRDKRIAILLPSAKDYIYPRLIGDISSVLYAEGYDFTVYVTDDNVANEREILTDLLEGNISGIITKQAKSSLPEINNDLYRRFSDINVPLLSIMNQAQGGLPYVCLDDSYAGFLAGRYLADSSCRTIALYLNRDEKSGIERYQGIITTLMDEHIYPNDDFIFWYGYRELKELRSSEDAEHIMSTLFSPAMLRSISRCSGLCVGSDEIGYYLIKALKKAGTDIPGRLKFVSFDNSYVSDFTNDEFVTIGSEAASMGRIIAEKMLHLIKSNDNSSIRLTPKLYKR